MIRQFLARRRQHARRVAATLRAFDGVPVEMIESAGEFVVTYDVPRDGGPDVSEEYYGDFGTPAEASEMFRTAFPSALDFSKRFDTPEVTNVRLCLIVQGFDGYRDLDAIAEAHLKDAYWTAKELVARYEVDHPSEARS